MRFLKSKYFAISVGAVVIGASLYFILHTRAKAPLEAPAENVATSSPAYKIIGYSVQGRKIESYAFGSGAKSIVFVGGIHGGYEWNAVLLAYDLLDYLKANPAAIPANVKVTVIPVLNPDGVYKVTGKEGRFTLSDVSKDKAVLASGRFNADDVDLNRNFACKWQAQSKWQSKTVSAGTAAFSEPEAQAFKKFVTSENPAAVVFWHSQAGDVFASSCSGGILPETTNIMNAYAKASGYPTANSFDNYAITGDSADWLSTIGIPALTVELTTHDAVEWDKNLKGISALIKYYGTKN